MSATPPLAPLVQLEEALRLGDLHDRIETVLVLLGGRTLSAAPYHPIQLLYLSCMRVLIKSRGCTQVVARIPAVPPKTKLDYNSIEPIAAYPLRERLGINHDKR